MKPVFFGKYIWKTENESELIFLFATIIDNSAVLNEFDLIENKFWEIQNIKNNKNKHIFTSPLIHEFDMLLANKDFCEMLKNNF